nr:uncharacterized protein LOC122581409 isoform X2 [Erigeron canadensis]XP_043609574.1 uncharacterized protein LOC122581409 isoform X2 [Erigeron canadensis]
MNLDLNLAPDVHFSRNDQLHTMSFEDWLLGSMREVVSNRAASRQPLLPVSRLIPFPVNTGSTGLLLAGGSTGDDETSSGVVSTNGYGDKKDVEKDNGDEGGFFDCNICLDLATEPVVTCCGHLFCWPCLYRWLFVHSDAKECPNCKGEVTMKTITPIYCRGNATLVSKVVDSSSSVKIPSRPQANRIESWRQVFQRNAVNMPVFDMIRRLDNRFDLTRDPISDNPQESPTTPLLNRIFTSRGIRSGRRDTEPYASPDTEVDLPNQDDTIPNLTSAESFVESYFRDRPDERNQEELSLVDRHSMSSIAGMLQSDSQTAEAESRASVSATSRRRNESSTSRISDVDSGSSRSRRRRLR